MIGGTAVEGPILEVIILCANCAEQCSTFVRSRWKQVVTNRVVLALRRKYQPFDAAKARTVAFRYLQLLLQLLKNAHLRPPWQPDCTRCGIRTVSEMLSNGVPIPTIRSVSVIANPNITLSICAHALEADEVAASKIWDNAMTNVISGNQRESKRMLVIVSADGKLKPVTHSKQENGGARGGN